METVSVSSIYKLVRPSSHRKLALVAQNVQVFTRKRDGVEEEVDRKLRVREQLFISKLQDMGIRSVEYSALSLQNKIDELTCPGAFDMCVVTGEPVYQLIEIGARIRNMGFAGPIYLELTEEDAERPASLAAAARNAKVFKAEHLLRNLVYLTKSIRDAPRHLQLDIEPLLVEPVAGKHRSKVTRAGSRFHEISAVPIDLSEPPKRVATKVARIIRDSAAATALKNLYRFKCQLCGMRIEVSSNLFYIEVHHVKPLGGTHQGPDVHGNMLVLCPNHHAMFDFGIPIFTDSQNVQIHGKIYSLTSKHRLDPAAISYHNDTVRKHIAV